MTLFSAMNITMAINTHCEIEISIATHTVTLLRMCENTYYEIATLISLFCLCFCNHVRRCFYRICVAFYNHRNTFNVLQ